MARPPKSRSGAAAALAAALALSAGRPGILAASVAAAAPRLSPAGARSLSMASRAFSPEPLLRMPPADVQPLVRLGKLASSPVGRELGLASYSFLTQLDPARPKDDRRADAPVLSPVAQAWTNRGIRDGVLAALGRFEDMTLEQYLEFMESPDGKEEALRFKNAAGALRSAAFGTMGEGLADLKKNTSRGSDLESLEIFLSLVQGHAFYDDGATFSHAAKIREARARIERFGGDPRGGGPAASGAVAAGRAAAPRRMPGLQPARPAAEAFEGVAQSPEMAELLKVIEVYAPEDYTVLIQGETGAGKELAAAALHYAGPRAEKGAFIRFNAPNLSATLIESELFGHEKGAFTDATETRVGLLEAADNGTVLIDEIGDLPLDLQAKLLRFLQEGTIRRVGGNKDLSLDVRVLAATHVDLEKAVAEGRFLPDLYYRLNVLPLKVPALRERASDIEPLARHFWDKFAPGRPFEEAFADKAVLEALRAHRWPGNVRELRNAVERAAVLSGRAGRVDKAHLFPEAEASAPALDAGAFARSAGELDEIWERLVDGVVQRAAQRAGAVAQKIAGMVGLDRNQVGRVLARSGLARTAAGKAGPDAADVAFDGVARSPGMVRMLEAVGLVAPHGTTVLIIGETGTGKELVARAIVKNSRRAGGPFVSFNGTDLTETLIESELFGHEKGAFTGAGSRRIGLLESAQGGTVFIDEVGRLSPGLQAKLLRFLESGTIRRVGGTEEIELDVRVVAATNADLAGLVREGRFREDLYHRLNVFPISSPPLRDRMQDILPLAEFFWDQAEAGRADARGLAEALSEEAREALLLHGWAGNVRELQSAVRRAAVLSRAAPGRKIQAAHLFPGGSYRPQPSTIGEAREIYAGVQRETARWAARTFGSWSAAAQGTGIDRRKLAQWSGEE